MSDSFYVLFLPIFLFLFSISLKIFPKNFWMKLIQLFFIFIMFFFLLFAPVFTSIALNLVNSDFYVLLLLLLYSLAAAQSIIFINRHFSGIRSFIFTATICIYYLFILSVVFGSYYFSHFFPSKLLDDESIAEDLKKLIDARKVNPTFLESLIDWTRGSFMKLKIGLPYFFESPNYKMINLISITQLLIGKAIDVVIIGSLANYILKKFKK